MGHEGHCGGAQSNAPLAPVANACEVQCTDGAPSVAAPDLPPVMLAVLPVVPAPAALPLPERAPGFDAPRIDRRAATSAPAVRPLPELTSDARWTRACGRAPRASHALMEVACLHSRSLPRANFGAKHLAPMVVALALACPPPAAAEPPLSLAEALKIAVGRSQQIVSQRAMVDAAREMSVAGGELPDPKLKLGVENVPTDGADAWSLTRDFMTMSKIGVMQEFPRAEKRRLRSERAQRDAERGTVAIESATLAVERDAATAWLVAPLHGGSRAGDRRADRRSGARGDDRHGRVSRRQGAAERADRRAEHGDRAPQPRDRSIGADAARADRAREVRRRRRRAAAGRGSGPRAAARRRSARRPRRRSPKCGSRRRRSRSPRPRPSSRAQAKKPDWSAELSYAVRGSPYSNMVSLMFTIDLPWSPGTRQDREHAAKLRERDAARAMLEDARRMRSAEVQSMQVEWQSARAQAQRIRGELLPLAVQRREAALAAYRGGTGPLAAVLDARRAELDAELALINQDQAVAKAWAFLTFRRAGHGGIMTSGIDSQRNVKLAAVVTAVVVAAVAGAGGYWFGTRNAPVTNAAPTAAAPAAGSDGHGGTQGSLLARPDGARAEVRQARQEPLHGHGPRARVRGRGVGRRGRRDQRAAAAELRRAHRGGEGGHARDRIHRRRRRRHRRARARRRAGAEPGLRRTAPRTRAIRRGRRGAAARRPLRARVARRAGRAARAQGERAAGKRRARRRGARAPATPRHARRRRSRASSATASRPHASLSRRRRVASCGRSARATGWRSCPARRCSSWPASGPSG